MTSERGGIDEPACGSVPRGCADRSRLGANWGSPMRVAEQDRYAPRRLSDCLGRLCGMGVVRHRRPGRAHHERCSGKQAASAAPSLPLCCDRCPMLRRLLCHLLHLVFSGQPCDRQLDDPAEQLERITPGVGVFACRECSRHPHRAPFGDTLSDYRETGLTLSGALTSIEEYKDLGAASETKHPKRADRPNQRQCNDSQDCGRHVTPHLFVHSLNTAPFAAELRRNYPKP